MAEPLYPTSSPSFSEQRRALAPEIEKAFQAFSHQVFAEGALPRCAQEVHTPTPTWHWPPWRNQHRLTAAPMNEIDGLTIDVSRAMMDPAGTFRSPDEVVHHPQLTLDKKIEILCTWAYDVAELAVAEEEGMSGGEVVMDLSAVMKALDSIATVDPQTCAPTKQAGFCIAHAARK